MSDDRNVCNEPHEWDWAAMPRSQSCTWPKCGVPIPPDNGACCHTLLPEEVADAIRLRLREKQLHEFDQEAQ